MATTPVGDRHVLAELLRRGWALGGEQSGHIIDTGFVPAGDGTASALLTLEALQRRRPGRPRQAMTKLPQKLVNVRVGRPRRARRGRGRLGRGRARVEGASRAAGGS